MRKQKFLNSWFSVDVQLAKANFFFDKRTVVHLHLTMEVHPKYIQCISKVQVLGGIYLLLVVDTSSDCSEVNTNQAEDLKSYEPIELELANRVKTATNTTSVFSFVPCPRFGHGRKNDLICVSG